MQQPPNSKLLFSPQDPLPVSHDGTETAASKCPILNPPQQDPTLVPRKCPVIHKDDQSGVSISPAPGAPATASSSATSVAELSPSSRIRKALCSAGFASIITTMITGALWQPIITILVRQQFMATQQAPSVGANNFFNVGKTVASEGKRIFFRGLTPRLMQSPLACIQWTTYEIFRETLANRNESTAARLKYALVFVMSRALVTAAKCPFEVVKERMQVQGIIPNFHQLSKHSSSLQHFRYIVNREGFPALFRALPINICRDIPIAVLMMIGNDFFTHLYLGGTPVGFFDKYFANDKKNRQSGGKTASHISFLAGASAGLVATVVTQPIDVAKTIIQTQGLALAAQQQNGTSAQFSGYTGLIDVLRKLRAEKGVQAWFSGTPLRAAHLMLGGAIYLPLYRKVQQQLKFGFDVGSGKI